MNRISVSARWLVVLVGSFAVLVVLLVPGVEENLPVQITSQALICAYALAGAYFVYELFGRGGQALPPASPMGGQPHDSHG